MDITNEIDYSANDIGINTATLYYLNNTLINGRYSFIRLAADVSMTDISGVDSKIVGMFDKVKAKVPILSDSFLGMSDTVKNVKNCFEKNFPECSDLFEYLDNNNEELLDNLLDRVDSICDVDKLMSHFSINGNKNNTDLKNVKASGKKVNISDLYNDTLLPDGRIVDGETYVRLLEAAIIENYSGGEAAAKAILLPMGLAADKGYYISYEHKSTEAYTNYGSGVESRKYMDIIDVLNKGSDCCGYVSYGTGIGSSVNFGYRAVDGFKNKKYIINNGFDYSAAKPGDHLANQGHVMMVIENNPETRTLIIAESSHGWYQVNEWTYEEVYSSSGGLGSGGFTLYDGSSFYLDN